MTKQTYTIRYRNFQGERLELCVDAEHVTEAIEAARSEVKSLRDHPGRIESVVRGC